LLVFWRVKFPCLFLLPMLLICAVLLYYQFASLKF
jgi:hypothetical protein